MKLPGELYGELIGVIGSASVRIRSITRYDWSRFVGEGKRFVRVRGWPQNPAAYGLTSSILVPGIPSSATTYSEKLSRSPQINPPTTGNYSGNSAPIEVPDLFADSKMAWAVARRWFGI